MTGVFLWRDVIESHVRPSLIVVPAPGLDGRFCILHGFEPVQVQTFIAQRAIEGLDVAVVGRFAWPAEVNPRVTVIRPQVKQTTREFATVIDEQILRAPNKMNSRQFQRSPANEATAQFQERLMYIGASLEANS